MVSTNFFPKDPVPPVTRTTCSDQFIPPASCQNKLPAPQTIVQPSPASGEAQPPQGLQDRAARTDLKLRGDMEDRVVQVVSFSTLNFLHSATDKDSYSSSDIRSAMESLSAIKRSSS